MKRMISRTIVGAFVAMLLASPAHAVGVTTTILSGSDTISTHIVTSEAAAAYNFLSNAGTGSVLVINDFGAGAGYGGGGFGPLSVYTDYAGFGTATLSDYAGLMFSSPFACCSDPGTAHAADITARAADLTAYIAAGGNIYIEDYEGAAAWTPILGYDGAPGVVVSTGCTGDPGVPTAQGTAFGYVGGSFGCYTHQIYDAAYFASFGFVSLVDGCEGSSGPGPGVTCGSVILGSGAAAVPTAVPEPATIALLGTGLLTGLRARRKKAARKL